jgi:hypothetical protein
MWDDRGVNLGVFIFEIRQSSSNSFVNGYHKELLEKSELLSSRPLGFPRGIVTGGWSCAAVRHCPPVLCLHSQQEQDKEQLELSEGAIAFPLKLDSSYFKQL